MKLTRCSAQGASLERFYGELAASDDHVSREIGAAMLRLRQALIDSGDHRQCWGLTSLYHLWLLAADDYTSPWLVQIIGRGDQYQINYRLPDAVAPWPNALVQGEAASIEQAVDMIRIAMDRSEGWSGQPPR